MIKVTLGEKPKEEKKFPKLMIQKDNKRIVLFIKKHVGVQISDESPDYDGKSGDYSEHWATVYFTDYNEPITLQNL